MKKIEKIIGYTHKEYEILVLSVFMNWCDKHSNSDRELQHLLSYQELLNWFKMEFKALENEFIESTKPYIKNLDKVDALKYYSKVVSKILEFFPSALFPDKHKFTSRPKPVNFFESHKN